MSCYVALDGPDGCGKSTQAAALARWLDAEGAEVLHVREPGSTPVGEALRDLLLSPSTGELQPITEVLLFSAARAELMQHVVRPALAAGKVVVAERCPLEPQLAPKGGRLRRGGGGRHTHRRRVVRKDRLEGGSAREKLLLSDRHVRRRRGYGGGSDGARRATLAEREDVLEEQLQQATLAGRGRAGS